MYIYKRAAQPAHAANRVVSALNFTLVCSEELISTSGGSCIGHPAADARAVTRFGIGIAGI